MTTTFYYKIIALSALILLKQQSFAGPINNINSGALDSPSTEGNDTDEAGSTTTITVEAATTQPPRDMFDGYPDVMKLKMMLGRTGLYRTLEKSNALPTALWNTSADNLTEACHKYLKEHLPAEKEDSCAATYVCDVQEDFHKFPAVVIKAECEMSRCVNSDHLGIGVVEGSKGSCQTWSIDRIIRLEFKPDKETRRAAHQQSGSESDSAEKGNEDQQQGTWEWKDEAIPINCRCRAK